jgi:Domain of unknown function (DUF4129)
MNAKGTSNLTRNTKVFQMLSYLLVFLMMACAVMTLSTFLNNLALGWHAGIIASILLFVTIDRLYTYRQLRTLTSLSSEWAIAIGGQWLLILLLMRFLLSYANGLDAFRADLSRFARGEIGELFTAELAVSLLLALLTWYLCGRFLDLLEEIGLDPALALDDAPVQMEVIPAHQRLVSLIFGVGIVLVVLTALARINMQTIASTTQGLPKVQFNGLSGGEAGVLLYFVFGLALLSLSRLMSLWTHWNRLRIPVSSGNFTRQWGIYSLLFLVILAIFISLLPAGDSLGFFSVLNSLITFLVSIIFFIGQVLLGLLLLLISIPLFLLGKPPPALRFSAPPVPVLPPAESVVPPTSNAAWVLLRSILLWGSLAALIVFSFVQFVRQHGGLRAALRNSRITNWLILAWQWLYRNADKTRESLSRVIVDGWQNILSRLEARQILPPTTLLRLRSLDPRRQIYFFYLAMVRRGGEQGLPRKPSQTPSEYALTLEKSLPSASDDIDSITEAFVEARYSRRAVESQDANRVKATWTRIRAALRDKDKRDKAKSK